MAKYTGVVLFVLGIVLASAQSSFALNDHSPEEIAVLKDSAAALEKSDPDLSQKHASNAANEQKEADGSETGETENMAYEEDGVRLLESASEALKDADPGLSSGLARYAEKEKIEIAEARKDDFRREIMNYIGALAVEGKIFNYKMNERLHKALELKLFEDQKDSIKLTSLVSQVVDKDTQARIDIVKNRLVSQYGYCEVCATDVLNYVASIFARGDTK